MQDQNCCQLYYRFVYWYCSTFIHVPVMSSWINKMKLMIYKATESIQLNFKDIAYKYSPKKSHNNTNIESCDSMNCALINYILMLILEDICVIYLHCCESVMSKVPKVRQICNSAE